MYTRNWMDSYAKFPAISKSNLRSLAHSSRASTRWCHWLSPHSWRRQSQWRESVTCLNIDFAGSSTRVRIWTPTLSKSSKSVQGAAVTITDQKRHQTATATHKQTLTGVFPSVVACQGQILWVPSWNERNHPVSLLSMWKCILIKCTLSVSLM